MPLVTLTCSPKWFPPDAPISMGFPTREQMDIVALATELPSLFIDHADKLHLEADTPQDAVQVDIRKFHAYAVNSVDLWVHVWLTEADLNAAQRLELRDTLVSILEEWFSEHEITLSWALDVFFGPGHGVYTDADSRIAQRW